MYISRHGRSEVTFQRLFAYASLVCFMILGLAYFIEYGLAKVPCPLCILQRYMLWAIALCFLLAAIFKVKVYGRYIYCGLIIFFAGLGLGLSLRQVYLQHLPHDALPNCTAGFERLMAFHPISEALKMILTSAGECANVEFEVFGLSLAMWSTMMFLSLGTYALFIILWTKKRRV